jgi:uncharacterized protein (TIGR04141 family)
MSSLPTPPDWETFLEQGTSGPLDLEESATNSAVLLVRVQRNDGDRWVAFTFGLGRYLLNRDWLERRFGLRVCLNLAYPRGEIFDGSLVPARLKTIDAKTIDEVTYDTHRRASRSVPLENFGLNIRRDLMAGVQAYPADPGEWGKVVQGATSFRHSKALRFAEIGQRARRLVDAWSAADFRDRFSFIENIQPVDDERIEDLEATMVDLIFSDDHGGFDLVPPEDYGSEAIAGFKLPNERGTSYDPELTLDDYLKYVGGTTLDPDRLKRDRLKAVDLRGNVLGRPAVFDFLTGQLVLDSGTYILVEGVFYEVHNDYLKDLATDIQSIPRYAGALPPWYLRWGTTEAAYNANAATCSSDLLLLDKLTVRPAGRSSDVEVCDLLTRNGALLHVKKKSRSSTLSHLFSQGHVSADLLVRDVTFRSKLIDLVDDVEQKRATHDDGFQIGFKELFSLSAATPSHHEIVFVIIGDWKGQPSPLSLPFFSRVNLRQRTEDLKAMGFRVSCACIERR